MTICNKVKHLVRFKLKNKLQNGLYKIKQFKLGSDWRLLNISSWLHKWSIDWTAVLRYLSEVVVELTDLQILLQAFLLFFPCLVPSLFIFCRHLQHAFNIVLGGSFCVLWSAIINNKPIGSICILYLNWTWFSHNYCQLDFSDSIYWLFSVL